MKRLAIIFLLPLAIANISAIQENCEYYIKLEGIPYYFNNIVVDTTYYYYSPDFIYEYDINNCSGEGVFRSVEKKSGKIFEYGIYVTGSIKTKEVTYINVITDKEEKKTINVSYPIKQGVWYTYNEEEDLVYLSYYNKGKMINSFSIVDSIR